MNEFDVILKKFKDTFRKVKKITCCEEPEPLPALLEWSYTGQNLGALYLFEIYINEVLLIAEVTDGTEKTGSEPLVEGDVVRFEFGNDAAFQAWNYTITGSVQGVIDSDSNFSGYTTFSFPAVAGETYTIVATQ